MRWLRPAGQRKGRRIPFILITPYRPAEYWDDSTRTVLDDFDVITVQSEEGIDDLRKLGYRRRIENIPLLPPVFAEPAPFAADRGQGRIRLGFLGRMAPQKNLGYLFEVYEQLSRAPKDDFHYELHLFGDGAERRELAERCAARSLPDVTFHGEIPRESVRGAIDTCDIFLNTSRTEGQCLAALEVLSRGRPLVATPVGALPEVLAQPDLGKLAPLDDSSAFAAKVTELAGEIREGRVSPRSVSEAFRKRYDAPAVLQRYLDLLADVCEPSGG
jgi:glycosyltransferase involved in cell wall biosynthesis